MRFNLLTYIWISLSGALFIHAQDIPFLQQIHARLMAEHPYLKEKEIFLSAFPPSQEKMDVWEKTQSTFRVARLKGGRYGFKILLAYDCSSPLAEILLKKKYSDSGFILLGLSSEDFVRLKALQNVLMDSSAGIMESGIKDENLFNTIQKHITR